MATSGYVTGRKKWSLPQAVVWANAYEISSGVYVPSGTEYQDFIILSDHNRQEINIPSERIENRKRMINATMRSYHVADKSRFSWSWEMLPSRAFDDNPQFSSTTGLPTAVTTMHTADGGAGGWDLKEWYENHVGPFYMLLSYDAGVAYGDVNKYTRIVHVYFSSFGYSLVKRGITDFWNVSVELEEV